MPLDPNIYGLIGRGVEQVANPFQVQAAQQQLEMQRLQHESLAEQRRAIAEERQIRMETARREEQEAVGLRGLKSYTPETLFPIVGPQKGAAILKGIEDFRLSELNSADAVRKSMLTRLGAIKALPESLRGEWYTAVVDDYAKKGLVDPSKVQPYSPQVLEAMQRELLTPAQRQEIDNPKPIEMAPGGVLVDPKTKQPIYTAPPRENDATVGTLGDFMDAYAQSLGLKSGRQLNPQQKLQAKSKFEAAGRAPSSESSALVAIMGPDGKPVLVPRSQAVGKTPASAARPLTQTAEATMIGRLANDWTKASASTKEIDRQVRIMDAGISRFDKDPNGASQAVLVTFQKILDPESVVRESEYARSSEGVSALQRIQGYMERLASGGAGVPLAQLREMAATAKLFQQATKQGADGVRRRLTATAERYNIPPEVVFDSVSSNPAAVNTGTVKMQSPPGPNGEPGVIKDVPAAHVEFFRSKGAKIVGGR